MDNAYRDKKVVGVFVRFHCAYRGYSNHNAIGSYIGNADLYEAIKTIEKKQTMVLL
jgi:hypothetical protein